MSMSKEALDFRKQINRNVSVEKISAYEEAEYRKNAHEEYIGNPGMSTRISIKEIEEMEL